MDMVDFLAAVAVTVDDQAIAVVGKTFITRNFRRDGHHATQRQLVLRGDVVDGRNQDIGDNQNMGRRLRRNIAKGGNKLILINNIRRDLPANDFAKIVSSAMTDSLLIFIPCSGLPLQINADAQDSSKSMSELLLFQPECTFSYAAADLADDGLSISLIMSRHRRR